MPLTEDETEKLQRIIDLAADAAPGQLSDWERSFLKDQQERFEKYGTDTRMSPKQWGVLDRILAALE